MTDTDDLSTPDAASSSAFQRRDALGLLVALGALGRGETALAQDAARLNPRAYHVLLENDQVRAVRYISQPGVGVCGVGRHSHPAHLTVAITPVKARVTLADGKSFVDERQPGDVFWEEASTHTVENVGGAGAQVILVEIKGSKSPPAAGG